MSSAERGVYHKKIRNMVHHLVCFQEHMKDAEHGFHCISGETHQLVAAYGSIAYGYICLFFSSCFYLFIKSEWKRIWCSITVWSLLASYTEVSERGKVMVRSSSGDIFTEFLALLFPEKCSTSPSVAASKSELSLLSDTPPCTSGSCSTKCKRSRGSSTCSDFVSRWKSK